MYCADHGRYNASKSDLFLKYQVGPNAGQIYNEPISVGDQYFWNYSNPGAARTAAVTDSPLQRPWSG